MKKMKKWIALLLTAAMTLSLAACGNGTQEPSASTEATPAADSSEKEAAPASEESAAEGEVTTLTFWSWLPTTECCLYIDGVYRAVPSNYQSDWYAGGGSGGYF